MSRLTEVEVRRVILDFDQRARAVELESFITDDEYATAAEIIALRDTNAELLALCTEMREWLKPELVKEPDRSFFWKLVRLIQKTDYVLGVPCTCGQPHCSQCGEDPAVHAGAHAMSIAAVEVTLPRSPDWWARHLMQIDPARPYTNSFTRWRVSQLYPVRRYVPPAPAVTSKKGKRCG